MIIPPQQAKEYFSAFGCQVTEFVLALGLYVRVLRSEEMEKELCNSISCPLCMEELDLTDLSLKPCLCGYQVCLYCLHYIREQQDGKCPACRTPYTEENFSVTKLDPQLATKQSRKRMDKSRERKGGQERVLHSPKTRGGASLPQHLSSSNNNNNNYYNWKRLRIIQRNLICVRGLIASICRADILKREELFGRFGNLLLILVDRGYRGNSTTWEEPTNNPNIVVYLLYETEAAASAAIKAMHNEVICEHRIQVILATTKYCNAFLECGKPQWCDNPYCLYRHESANPEDIVTFDSLQFSGLAPPPPHYLFSMKKFRRHSIPPPGYYESSRRQQVCEDSPQSFIENIKKLGTNTNSPASSGWSRSLDSDEQISLEDNSTGYNERRNLFQTEDGFIEDRPVGYWNSLETISTGNHEDPLMLSENEEFATLLDNVASIGSPALDISHSNNRISSRFDFHSDNEYHESDESLSPSDSGKNGQTADSVVDSKVSTQSTLLENHEWITPERRLEMMFGNDIVHHFVTLDTLPSLNDLLTRLQTSKRKEEEQESNDTFVEKEEKSSNISEIYDNSIEPSDKESSSVMGSTKEVEQVTTVRSDENQSNKKSQRKKRKQRKAKSESKNSSIASTNEASNDSSCAISSPEPALLSSSLDHQQSSYNAKDETVSSHEEDISKGIEQEEASKDSLASRNDIETIRKNPTSHKLEKELEAMKEKEMQLQKRLEELQTKLERLLLL